MFAENSGRSRGTTSTSGYTEKIEERAEMEERVREGERGREG